MKNGDVLKLRDTPSIRDGMAIGCNYAQTIVCLQVEKYDVTFITETGTLRTWAIPDVLSIYEVY